MEGPYSIQAKDPNRDLRENLTTNSEETSDSVSKFLIYYRSELPTYLARV